MAVISEPGVELGASPNKRSDTIYPHKSCLRWRYELQG